MIRSIPTYFEKTVENHSAYFQQLFRDHYEPLCARAFQMVHDRKASEDIVQDVFLALWERREEVDFDRPLLPLLFVAVKNRAIDLLRSKNWRGGNPDWTSWMSVFVRLSPTISKRSSSYRS